MTTFGLLNFHEPLWVYISIPVAAALVGWFTKIVAVKMIFYPIEFKGIPPYLGWQGQIPSHAAKMARVSSGFIAAGAWFTSLTASKKEARVSSQIEPFMASSNVSGANESRMFRRSSRGRADRRERETCGSLQS